MKFKNFVPAILAILRITEWTKSAEEKNTLTDIRKTSSRLWALTTPS